MAKKPTVTTLQSGFNSTEVLNQNLEALRDAFDNTLSLDGSTPNAMEADLDLNGNNIIGATGLLINGIDYVADVEAAKAAKDAALVAQSAASASATASASSATASAASATAASASETAAATSETNAAASAATATTKASEASTSATAAATSETNAATSEANAATSEANASTSETNAASSASAASASQVAAAASAASAANSYDVFDDRYLGSAASDPTLDNDGDPLVAGSLYFNTSANEMRVYDGANWIAASSAGGASLLNYNYTATSGQTTFSGADDNAATMSYTQQNLIVTLNGIVLEDGTDYTASNGTSIVLTTGAAAGDELNVVAFKSFTTADMVPASTGGTFSGNVTVSGAFTSQGIDDNATSTAMTLDSSGNLLVGKTSTGINTAGTRLIGGGAGAQFTADGTEAIALNRLTSDGDLIWFGKAGSKVGSIGSYAGNQTYITSLGGGIKFNWYSGTQAAIEPCSTTGAPADNLHDLGGSSARWQDLYLSGGVYLGGTGAANKLDDYEEGTWTPAVAQGTASTAYGSYTKVGRLVKVIGRISNFSDISTTQRVQITNLPFAAASTNPYESTGSAFARFTSKSAQAVYIPSGGDNVFFYAMAGGDWSSQELNHSDLQNSTADIYWSATYMTT